MEERILQGLRGAIACSPLDTIFFVSHELATFPLCLVLCLMAIAWWWRRDRHEGFLWVALGLSTLLIEVTLKPGFGRVRPHLWTGAVVETGFSLPSGHALASATFYPLLARAVALRRPDRARAAYLAAAAMALYIGIGRLYLGVHWPSDVLAGWTLGAAQTVLAMRIVDRLKGNADVAGGGAPERSASVGRGPGD